MKTRLPSRYCFLPHGSIFWLLAGTLISSSVWAGEFLLYPNSDEVMNPRLPAVPPIKEDGEGLSMGVETRFVYELAPFVSFLGTGRLEVMLRDNQRRARKQVISLVDGDMQIVLSFDSAAAGRSPLLTLSQGKKLLQTVLLGEPWGAAWKPVRLEWSERQLIVIRDGLEVGHLVLSTGFSPTQVSLETWHVDELLIEGNGRFRLGWENNYAASVEPGERAEAVQGRLFGFDTYAVSDRPEKRDFPMLQVLNGSDQPQAVTFAFAIRGEITGMNREWSQVVSAARRSTTMQALKFPERLVSDVYHLSVRTRGLSSELDQNKHFFAVEQRDEPVGPSKFGLHDSGNRIFGSWPDALGIDFAHVYCTWGAVVGPAWAKDFNGNYGLDPATPSKEWAWNKRIDWIIGQGLTPYVSLQSEPFLEWMRERPYAGRKLREYSWGSRGGFPKLVLYREFVHALAERYKGKVLNYEVENEPNSHAGGIPPADYVQISKAVLEEVHKVDPQARVFGICGTGDLVPWMTQVFADGGDRDMDGVSIHTYVTPQLPEQANLPEKLAEVRNLIDKTGRSMPLINSETGTYVAPREQVDHPISADRLKELINAGTPTLSIAKGWPNYALSEQVGSLSIVRNAVYNFLAGAERFVFFGWNPEWPAADWMSSQTRSSGAGGFALISATKDGVRTPSWQTLAVGVLTAQLKGAITKTGHPINQGGVLGGIFAKQNGGQVAVLWSSMGTRSLLLESTDPDLEIVSLYGQRRLSHATSAANGSLFHSIELTEDPVYIHVKTRDLTLQPSPVLNVSQINTDDGGIQVQYTLINRNDHPWSGIVTFEPQQGWSFEPTHVPFALEPSARAKFTVKAVAPRSGDRRAQLIEARTRLADGAEFSFPVGIIARPVVLIATLPDTVSADEFRDLDMLGERLLLNQPEQVMVGRPPQLSSLQEERYWNGSAELSGEVKIGRNTHGIFVYVDVVDAGPKEPAEWPSVRGSAVELFFDFRSVGAGFGGGFSPGAYQVVLKPSLRAGNPVEIWNASSSYGILKGTTASGERTEHGYRLMFHIPWEAIGRVQTDKAPFGFDVGIDGPAADGHTRKSQLMLFGTAANSLNSSNYGVVISPVR